MKFKTSNTLKSLNEFILVNPQWLSGFIDGEGCFTGSLQIDINYIWGLSPQCEFNIVQNKIDKLLLKAIKFIFNNIGGVYSKPNDIFVYSVRNRKDLISIIIPFLNKYPLITNKNKELVIFNNYLNEL